MGKTSSAMTGMVLFVLIGWILLFVTEQNPMEYTNEPFPVLTKNLTPGDTLYLEIGRCATREVPYTFSVQLFNVYTEDVIHLRGSTVSAPVGCSGVMSVPIELPSLLDSGTYKIKFFISIPGRYKTFEVHVESQKFTVQQKE